MHTEPRRGQIEKIVLHDNEGPQGNNAALNLAGYLAHIDGGYHCIVDDHNTVTVVGDAIEVWGNGGINSNSLDICLIGYASGTWTDPYSQAEIRNAVQWVAGKCKLYGIPAVHLTPREVGTPGIKGICTHGDVTAAGFSGSAGHTDPGLHFPIDAFVASVGAQLSPVDPEVLIELVKLDKWRNRVKAKPLSYGDQNEDVAFLVDRLRELHFLSKFVRGDKYGDALQQGVYKFKVAYRDRVGNTDGRHFGGNAADVMVSLA